MTSNLETKRDLLTRLHRERAAWEALVARVPDERVSDPHTLGEWSLKDTLAHISAWTQVSELQRLEAVLRGESPGHAATAGGWPVDEINQWIYLTNRYRSAATIAQEAGQTWERFAALLDAVPEQELTEPGRFPWMNGRALGPGMVDDMFGHIHDEHEPLLRAWLTLLESPL